MLQVDDEGYLLNEAQWTPEVAERLARAAGIVPLTDKHWKVVALCREESARNGCAPDTEQLSRLAGMTTAKLLELFPGEPARVVARIAGLPRENSRKDQTPQIRENRRQ